MAKNTITQSQSAAVDEVNNSGSPRPASAHEEISLLAYYYWQDRGCPEGSPEEDWLRAERTLRETSASTQNARAASA